MCTVAGVKGVELPVVLYVVAGIKEENVPDVLCVVADSEVSR